MIAKWKGSKILDQAILLKLIGMGDRKIYNAPPPPGPLILDFRTAPPTFFAAKHPHDISI